MGHQFMNSIPRRGSSVAATTLVLLLAISAQASEPDIDRFRAEIDAFIGRLSPSSNGVVRWAGSNPYEIQRDGDALLAIIENAHLSLETQRPGELILDRLEIREVGRREQDNLIELALALPKTMRLVEADGTETQITLRGARASTVVESLSGRGRETVIEIESARIDQPKSGSWISLGPLSMASKLVAEPSGGWRSPAEFEVKGIEYSLPRGPVGGGIDRIAFSGRSAGSKLSELEKLRDALDRLQAGDSRPPRARGSDLLAALPKISEPFSEVRGDLTVEGLSVRSVTGEALVVVAKAASTTEITGLDTEEAALRFSIRHEGLDLAPSVLENWKVPRRVVLDFGVADLSTRGLTDLLRALITATDQRVAGESESEANKQQAVQQALGAAAMLNPTFHIYDLAIDTEEVGVDLTAEAKGSPLAPKGYSASGDLMVRGFDAVSKLSDGMPLAEYLPVLREIGAEGTAPDGTPQLEFHLSSAPRKWMTINGNDVTSWFDGTDATQGQPRLLRPSDPPMRGNDVNGVQQALVAAKIPVEPDGVYNSATAAAVAHFQKQKGINVSGVVDAATRERLGGLADPRRQGGRN